MYYCFHVVHSALWSRMWSKLAPLKSTSGHPKLWSNHKDGSSSRKQKTGREKTQCGQPESSRPKYVVIQNPNRVVKPCGRKPLRAGKRYPISRAFLLPPVLYCNLESELCQGLKNVFPLPKYLGAINKEKGPEKTQSRFLNRNI